MEKFNQKHYAHLIHEILYIAAAIVLVGAVVLHLLGFGRHFLN